MKRLTPIILLAAVTFSGTTNANNDCPDVYPQDGDPKPCQTTTTSSSTTTSTPATTLSPTSTTVTPTTPTTVADPSSTTAVPAPSTTAPETSTSVEQMPPPSSSANPATTSPTEPLDQLPDTGLTIDLWAVAALCLFGCFLTLLGARRRL